MNFPVTENIAKSQRHTSFYLACDMSEATPIIFLHGWPELSISWRHQLPTFASLGFRPIAPDMRGYGRSSVYSRHEDYALEQVVADMIELLDAISAERAVWGRSRLGFASGLVDRSASSPALLWCSKSLRALYSGWLRS